MTIAELKNGTLEYLYADHLGPPVVGTDASRNILWRVSRTPYGESMVAISSRADRVGYTGHIEDADLKLTYMQARYYDPVLGRFMSNDPVGFIEGGTEFHNRYSYTHNDPANAFDPDGLSPRGFNNKKISPQQRAALEAELESLKNNSSRSATKRRSQIRRILNTDDKARMVRRSRIRKDKVKSKKRKGSGIIAIFQIVEWVFTDGDDNITLHNLNVICDTSDLDCVEDDGSDDDPKTDDPQLATESELLENSFKNEIDWFDFNDNADQDEYE